MRVKNTLILFIGIILLSSCKTSNDVVSNRLIQKRKYRSGFHIASLQKVPSDQREKIEHINRKEVGPSYLEIEAEEKTKERNGVGLFEGDLALKDDSPNTSKAKVKRIERKKIDRDPSASIDNSPLESISPERSANAPSTGNPEKDAIISLVLAGAWVLIAASIPVVNVVLPIIGYSFGKAAYEGGETEMGTIGKVANLVELIIGAIFTLFVILVVLFYILLFASLSTV